MNDSSDPYLGRSGRQWWLVLALMLAATVAVIDRSILSLLVDPIKSELGFSDTQMGLIFGLAFAIANVLFTLPAGYLADRISRRGIIAAGCVAWSVATSVCGLALGFLQLLLARASVGFAEGVIHPCSFSMLRGALATERRGRGFATYGIAIMFGSALGFLLGGAILQFYATGIADHWPLIGGLTPWRQVLMTLGILGLPFALLMLTVREPLRQRAITERAEGVQAALVHMRRYWRIYVPLLAYSGFVSMKANAYGAFLASIPQRRFAVPAAEVGRNLGLLMLLAAPLGIWLMGVAMDRLTRRYGVRGPVMVAIVTAALGFLFSSSAPIAPTVGWFYLFTACDFFVGGGGVAITAAIIASITPAFNMGKTTAIQLFVYGIIGMGAGPAITGLVSDAIFMQHGGIAPALSACCAVFTLAATICAVIVLRTIRHYRE